MSDSSEEKALPASERKIEKAREKGQIAHSKEMVTAAVTVACFGYVMLRAPAFATYLEDGLSSLPASYDVPFPEAVEAMGRRLSLDALSAVLPLIGLIATVAIVTNLVVNGGLVVSLYPVTPDPNKLNPVEGFKRIFRLNSVLELVKSVMKLVVAGVLVFRLIEAAMQALVEVPSCGLACGISLLGELLKYMLLVMAALFLVLGALDIGIQKWLFLRDQRMTRTELKRERKDSDGDPEIKKQHRRERRTDGAKTGLRNANFAIRSSDTVLALRYTQQDAPVPVLIARGREDGFHPLMEELRSLGVPIVFDAEAVAMLAPRLKVGTPILKEMFEPVIRCMYQTGVL